ncbi:MAG: type II toxin-antitoxin system VapC family toxin [Treponema sp.]|nr:type II toxin-antitoxin system VapC family toxin [Treponema sp.]
MDIILDDSAIIAVIADEPEAQIVINCTKGATIMSPNIISCEIANALTRMMRKGIITTKDQMIELIQNFKKIPLKMVEIDLEKTLEIAWNYKIYAYDAFYLETAKRLGFPIISFDSGMIKIAKELNLTVLGGQNVSI